MTEEQLQLILNATTNLDFRRIFVFAAYTGMRLNEILHLRWKDVNLNDKFIIVANHKTFTTKNKKERTIPINNKVSII